VTYTEAGAQGDTSGKVTKLARLETGPGDQGAASHPGRRAREGLHTESGEFGDGRCVSGRVNEVSHGTESMRSKLIWLISPEWRWEQV